MMPSPTTPAKAGAVTSRISTRFSADGSLAACLADDGQSLHPEVWAFTATSDHARMLRTPDGETGLPQLLPLPGDRALLIRHGDAGHDLVLLETGGTETRERRLATVTAPGFRLLAGHAPDTPILAMSWEARGRTTVWRVLPRAPWLERLAVVASPLVGGVGLDLSGRRLGFTRHRDDGATAVCLDLGDGSVQPLSATCPLGQTHTLLADPHSGLVMLAAETPAGLRLAYVHQRGPREGRVVFPDSLAAIEGTVRPLAVSPGGGLVALQVRRGARTHLLLHRVVDDEITEIGIPPGIIGGTAAWSSTGLRFPFSSPVCPSAIGTVTGSPAWGTHSWRLAGVDPAPTGQSWRPARLERFPGPADDIEAVVYGDWRTSERVVVALHGGPEAAWELDYHPMFQRLAAAGLAVIAPNQRGSTGYGHAHSAAIQHAWGGPDRDDICHLGRTLHQRRGAGALAPMLFGESYGAYLALLASGHQPQLWSRCAVVAPFLSAARLYDEASTAVQGLIDRLGGRTPLPAEAGDVLTIADRIRTPLLIIHGDSDQTVPVAQSRRLREHLLRSGRHEPTDFRYLEVPDADHNPLADVGPKDVMVTLIRFLSSARLQDQAPVAVGHGDSTTTNRREVKYHEHRHQRVAGTAGSQHHPGRIETETVSDENTDQLRQ
jgi:pimeloyl-ACP methyl ester carboxylesterase